FSGPIGGSGGGIYNDRGTLNLTRCTVQGNLGHREGSDGANGGGLFNKGGTVNVLDSAFQSSLIGTLEQSSGRVGYTGGRGGGIFNDASGKVTITSTEIRSNTAGQGGTGSDGAGLTVGSGHPGGNGGAGGGIYNEGEMKIVGCTIAGNQTGGGGVGGSSASSPGSGSDGGAGGGIYNVGTMTIENSTVADNATGDGGKGGSGMTDLTGGGNGGRGGNGGGIYTQKNLKMTNVTVTGNKTGAGGAGGSGGALRSNGSAGSSGHGGGVATGSSGPANESVTVKNTIIAANTTATGGSGPDVIGTFISSGHNLVGVVSQDLNDNDELNFTATGDQTGSSSSPLNAKLGPRQHNGGPQTSTYDLLDGSPAINAGDDSVTGAPSNLAYDQRGIGYVRKYNGHVDIGAIEKQPPSNPPVARCLSFNASAQSSCQYIPSASDFDGGSSDPDATDTLTLTLNPSGPLGLGTHSITLIVTDDRGLSSSCVSEVTVVDDVPPQLTVPPGRILFTGPSSTIGGVVVSDLSATLGTATAEDNCSTVTPVRTGVPAGNLFPIGVTTLNYTATDAKGQSTSKTQTVTVVDNTPPKITAPSDRTIYTGAGATLAGVVINNLDGELGTATASDNDSVASVVRSGVPGGNFFPTGMTILTYTARDPSGNATAATQKVTVVDNTAPTINGAAASPSVIWPANNKMVDVLVSYGAGDNSGGTVTTSLSISSNEQTGAGDMLVLDNHRVRLRADRAGKGSGRVYTIVITATDPYGNSSRRIVTVTVPHDQGK
ncbi:MAG TPA: HYR domain-containing protein, partial [Pyrinomonadaceae bacterium]|nr:HYR domain-containing protein [Pyrinomonadaceae bacterium]